MTTADLAAMPAAASEPPVPRPFGPFPALIATIGVVLLALAVAVATGLVIGAVLYPEGVDAFFEAPDTSPFVQRSQELTGLLASALIVVFTVVIARMRGGRRFGELLGLSFHFPKRVFWIGLAIMTAMIVVETALEELHPPLKEIVELYMALPSDRAAWWILVFGVLLAAPVSEELLIRGFLYTALRAKWGVATALIISSVLFSALHFEETGFYALLVLPSAFLFGWLRERSGGIALPIVMHALMNLAAVLTSLYGAG